MKKIADEFRGKTISEIEKEIKKLREELAKLKLETTVGPIKDTNLLTKKRKRLAVALTILTEKREKEKLKLTGNQ